MLQPLSLEVFPEDEDRFGELLAAIGFRAFVHAPSGHRLELMAAAPPG